ncbi:MAG: hypothetical protein J7M15_04230 [Anaerolineae bacterium]|nr:hypothetical protein [Anaerolineae bacterium]
MNPVIIALWLIAGAAMAVLNALAIAVTMPRFPDSPDKARRLLVRTLPLRLALQAVVLYGAVRCGMLSVLAWLLGYIVGRSLVVGWALRHAKALGNALRQG